MPKRGKNVLAIMLGGAKSRGGSKKARPKEQGYDEDYESEPEEEEEDEGEYGAAFKESAEAALQAIQEGSSDDFASALKDAIVTCLEEQEI